MSEHCGPHATPWHVEIEDGYVAGIYGQPCGSGCNGRIVETDCGYYPPGEAEANLIVNAVNAFKEGLATESAA